MYDGLLIYLYVFYLMKYDIDKNLNELMMNVSCCYGNLFS